jgi:hypothetical protein
VPELNRLYREYADRAAFYVVYIQEAHPIDAWQVRDNLEDEVLLASTSTMVERSAAADMCVANLGIELPALLDGIDGRVEQDYTGWPDRLYVIDVDGRVAFKSAAGPFGFEPADVERTLGQLLAR